MLQNEHEYEVTIPRGWAYYTLDDWGIFWEYYFASYAGEKLSEVASTFSYWVPPVKSKTPFTFYCECPDLEKFAEVIFYIISGYDNPDYETNGVCYYETQLDFFSTAAVREREVACWGLAHLCLQYQTKVMGDPK